MDDFPTFQDRPRWPGIAKVYICPRSYVRNPEMLKLLGVSAKFSGDLESIDLDGEATITVKEEHTRFSSTGETVFKFSTRHIISDELVVIVDVNGDSHIINWHPELCGKLECQQSVSSDSNVQDYTLTTPTTPLRCILPI